MKKIRKVTLGTLFLTAFVACLLAELVPTLGIPINLTGNFEDFLQFDPPWSCTTPKYPNPGSAVPLPGVIYYEADDYPLNNAEPLPPAALLPGYVMPTGFHPSRMAYTYDCDTDSLYVGADCSNAGYAIVGCVKQGESVAWDADGDGIVNLISNPLLVPGYSIADEPRPGRSEKYILYVDFDGPGTNPELSYDLLIVLEQTTGGGPLPGPAGTSLGLSLAVFGYNNILLPAWTQGKLKVDAVYHGNTYNGSPITGPDIEFRITGLKDNIPGSNSNGSPINPCKINAIEFWADTDLDQSNEIFLLGPGNDFTKTCDIQMECKKEARILPNGEWQDATLVLQDADLCKPLPNVQIRYRVKNNTPDCSINATVTDVSTCQLPKSCTAVQPNKPDVTGVSFPYTFENLKPGEEAYIICNVSFDTTWCGNEPCSNLMTVTAVPADCCAIGSAECSDSLVIEFPPQIPGSFSCEKKVRLKGSNEWLDTLTLTNECFPITVEYRLRATNTGNTPLNFVINETDFPACATVTCNPALPATFNNVPGGESREVICEVTFQKACAATLCGTTFTNTMTVRATTAACCGLTPVPDTCTDSASIVFPQRRNSNFTCEKSLRKQGSNEWTNSLTLTNECFPLTIEYRLKVTNTGDTTLDLTVNETDWPACAQVQCKEGANNVSLPKTFQNVPPGESREVICTVTFPKACAATLCGTTFTNTMTSSAVLSQSEDGCCTNPPPSPKTCTATLNFPPKRNSNFSCEKKVRKQGTTVWSDTLNLTNECFPFTVEYLLKVTNTGDTTLDLTIDETDWPACAQVQCKEGANNVSLPKTFQDVPPGESREVICMVTFPKACDPALCGTTFTNTMTISAVLSALEDGCCTNPPAAAKTCSASVVFPPVKPSDFTCEAKVRLLGETAWRDQVNLDCNDPNGGFGTVQYKFTVTNTGQTNLDFTINENDFPSCAQVSCTPAIPATFLNVPPGQSREVICNVNFTKACEKDWCGKVFAGEMIATATPSADQCCAQLPNPATCRAVTRVVFPPKLDCRVTTDPPVVLKLPATVKYTFTATNTASYPVNIEINVDWGIPAPIISCDNTLPYVFNNVPPGNSVSVSCDVTFPANFEAPGDCIYFAKMTAKIPGGDCCVAECLQSLSLPCDCNLKQATKGRSLDLTHRPFAGYLGQTEDDPITAAPYVFTFDPGENWSNFVSAAHYPGKTPDGRIIPAPVPYTLLNVTFQKSQPAPVQCADMFPAKTISQQGTNNIRRWWPLMYEPPWTTFTLTVCYKTQEPMNFPTENEGEYRVLHCDVWNWCVGVTVQDLKRLVDLFHQIPAEICEVPLIADENLYLALQEKLDQLQEALDAKDKQGTGTLIGEFEMMVQDACMPMCPPKPFPINNARGEAGAGWIINSDCMPACCKLMADAEYIIYKYINGM